MVVGHSRVGLARTALRFTRRGLWSAGAFLVLHLGPPVAAAAQAALILGQIVDEATGKPIAGARIGVLGLTAPLETETDSLGRYQLDDLPNGDLTLRADAHGYASLTHEVHLNSGQAMGVTFRLPSIAIALQQAKKRPPRGRSQGISQGTVEARYLAQHSNESREAVTARAPGAVIIFNGAGVGSVTQILMRGQKTFLLSGEPLYYLDGMLVSPPAPRGRGTFGSPSILDLLDASVIERIEVLPGSAAIAAYGPGSANGVVLIYTKH